MGVPIYAFVKMVARSEYFQLGEEGRSQAWWKVVREVGSQDTADVETIVMCRGIVEKPCFHFVHKYPDMDTYIKYARIWWSKTHIQKYFDSTVELGCAPDDLNEAFGEMTAEKATW